MRHDVNASQILISLAMVFLICFPSSGENRADTPLRISISSPSETYLVGEPVVLDLKLTNEGSETVKTTVPSAIAYTSSYLSFRSPVCSDWTRYSPTLHKSTFAFYRELGPGESLMTRGIFVASMNTPGASFFLRQPGEHLFRMSYLVHDGGPLPEGGLERITSNTIAVTVREPQGREVEALELWNEALKQSSYSFQAVSVAGGRPLMQLLSDYGDTTYAQYGKYTLVATTRTMSGSELQGRSVGGYNTEFLESILETAPADFPLRDEVLYRLAGLYRSNRHFDEALELLDHLLSEMPDSIRARNAIELRARIESRIGSQ